MDAGVFFYNFGWKDYHEASMANILDMVKVLSFALSEGKVSITGKEECRRTPFCELCEICSTVLNSISSPAVPHSLVKL